MDARDRLARAAAAIGHAVDALAHGVVEHEHAVSAGRGSYQPFRLRVVDVPDFVFVVKVLHRALLPNEGKPFAVERNRLADRPDVKSARCALPARCSTWARRTVAQRYRCA